jgi:hypothetical protein
MLDANVALIEGYYVQDNFSCHTEHYDSIKWISVMKESGF